MKQPALSQLLHSLIATWENEMVEFKQAGNDYSTDDIGKYFSALANEANLRGTECRLAGVRRQQQDPPCGRRLLSTLLVIWRGCICYAGWGYHPDTP